MITSKALISQYCNSITVQTRCIMNKQHKMPNVRMLNVWIKILHTGHDENYNRNMGKQFSEKVITGH